MSKFSKIGKNLFYFDYKSAFSGIKYIKQIFLTFKELIPSLKTYYHVSKIQKRAIANLRYHLHCKIEAVRSNYIFVGKDHLEINPYYGVFLYGTHRLLDIFPNITFVCKQQDQDILIEAFLDSFCPLNFIYNDDSSNKILTLDKTYDSISLNFVLDTIPNGYEELKAFFIYLKSRLNPGGIVFGVTVCGKNTKLTKKQKEYIQQKNNSKEWFNSETSSDMIMDILEDLFDVIGVEDVGACTIFRASLTPPIKDVLPHKLDIDKIGNKYLIIK